MFLAVPPLCDSYVSVASIVHIHEPMILIIQVSSFERHIWVAYLCGHSFTAGLSFLIYISFISKLSSSFVCEDSFPYAQVKQLEIAKNLPLVRSP